MDTDTGAAAGSTDIETPTDPAAGTEPQATDAGTDAGAAEGEGEPQSQGPDYAALLAKLDASMTKPAPMPRADGQQPKADAGKKPAWSELKAPAVQFNRELFEKELGVECTAALKPVFDAFAQIEPLVKVLNELGPGVLDLQGFRQQSEAQQQAQYEAQVHSWFDKDKEWHGRYGTSHRAASAEQRQMRELDHNRAVALQRALGEQGEVLTFEQALEMSRNLATNKMSQPAAVRKVQAQVSRAGRRLSIPASGPKGGEGGGKLSPRQEALARSRQWQPADQE